VIGRLRAQSMTEYALILAAIALVVFAAYEGMGNTVSKLVSGEESTLSSASSPLSLREITRTDAPASLLPGGEERSLDLFRYQLITVVTRYHSPSRAPSVKMNMPAFSAKWFS